jgi:hypothetical protein
VRPARIELATLGLGVPCSIQFELRARTAVCYADASLVRRISPAHSQQKCWTRAAERLEDFYADSTVSAGFPLVDQAKYPSGKYETQYSNGYSSSGFFAGFTTIPNTLPNTKSTFLKRTPVLQDLGCGVW